MKRTLIFCAALAVCSVPGVSRADSQDDKAAAQAAYDLGRKLALAGNFNDACPKFEESQQLDPELGTMLFLADCYEKTGKTASAWGEFREAEAIAAKESDAREKVAHDRASVLEPQLSRVVVQVDAPNKLDGLHVTRDNVEIGQGLWSVPFPIDPGAHDIAASALGHKSWIEHVQILPNGSTATIVVPLLLDAPDASAAQNPAVFLTKSNEGGRDLPPEAPPRDGSKQRILGVAVAGVGVVAAVAGIFLGLSAKSKLDDSNADNRCGLGSANTCTQVGVDDRSDANAAATESTIAFVVAGVLVAGGAALYFTAPHGNKPAAHLVPAVGPKSAGFALGAAW